MIQRHKIFTPKIQETKTLKNKYVAKYTDKENKHTLFKTFLDLIKHFSKLDHSILEELAPYEIVEYVESAYFHINIKRGKSKEKLVFYIDPQQWLKEQKN